MNTENKLPEDFKKKWVAALRSGEYKQGKGTLYNADENTYCCIGVACHLHNNSLIRRNGILPNGDSGYDAIPHAISGGFQNQKAVNLINMNDAGKSFSEIADWIEANL